MATKTPEQEQIDLEETNEHAYTPVYVSIQTVTAFLDGLDAGAIPKSIDRSMMLNQSGGVQRKLMSALVFLGLIRPGGEVTEALKQYVALKDQPDKRKASLATII